MNQEYLDFELPIAELEAKLKHYVQHRMIKLI